MLQCFNSFDEAFVIVHVPIDVEVHFHFLDRIKYIKLKDDLFQITTVYESNLWEKTKPRQNSYTPPFLHTQRKGAQKTNHSRKKLFWFVYFSLLTR